MDETSSKEAQKQKLKERKSEVGCSCVRSLPLHRLRR